MLYSMTGYGRAEILENGRRFVVEMKSVNNRYLDINIRMSKMFAAFDAGLRSILKEYIRRGKVDVFVTYEDMNLADTEIRYNEGIAARYVEILDRMQRELDVKNDITTTRLAQMPDVLKMDEARPDEEVVREHLFRTMREAAKAYNETRIREGAYLEEDLISKLVEITGHVDFITERAPTLIAGYEEKLKERITALLDDKQIDENRLLTEVAIFADKSSIDEELVRLKSHIGAFRDMVRNGDVKEGIGRKMDFMIQEMNRESNTILSKSNDMEISAHAVEVKTTIEKIREQIQNVE